MSLELTTTLNNNQQLNMTPDVMKMLMQYTNMFAEASIIPDHYRGRKGDIFIAVQTAHRMNLDPMTVMQGTYVIHGKLGMTSAFAISLANTSGLLKSGISYSIDGEGPSLRVTAKATLKSNNEEISYSIGMVEAKAEGWTEKKGSKYKTMPELMLRYRAATLLIRTHIPQVLNGMRMTEELEDVHGVSEMRHVGSDSATNNIDTRAKSTNKVKNRLEAFIESEDDKAASDVIEQSNDTIEVALNSDIGKLKNLITKNKISSDLEERWCEAASVTTIEELPGDKIAACIDYIENRIQIDNSVE